MCRMLLVMSLLRLQRLRTQRVMDALAHLIPRERLCRRFLACCSRDALGHETVVKLDVRRINDVQ